MASFGQFWQIWTVLPNSMPIWGIKSIYILVRFTSKNTINIVTGSEQSYFVTYVKKTSKWWHWLIWAYLAELNYFKVDLKQ